MRPEVLDYELLVKARDWLSDRKHWIKNALFRGETIEVADATCALGALGKVMGTEEYDVIQSSHAYTLLVAALPKGNDDVPSYNDAQANHRGILGLFARAIKKAKELATAPLKR